MTLPRVQSRHMRSLHIPQRLGTSPLPQHHNIITETTATATHTCATCNKNHPIHIGL
jgi:hypothetical protein